MAVIDVIAGREGSAAEQVFLGVRFDLITQKGVVDKLRESVAMSPFRYIVTPNVDYVVRMHADRELRDCVAAAWLTVCDSRPIAGLARLLFLRLPLVTGSDLTAELFRSAINDGDSVTLVAPNHEVVERLRKGYPKIRFSIVVPPMDVRNNAAAMQECVDFVVRARSRFVFLAIGSPQSDILAYRLARHPSAVGIGLNVGASLEFLVGTKKRAPKIMRQIGLEWMHRLLCDPRRLWRRYCYSVLPLLKLFSHEVRLALHL
ncbi:MAG: WecB/TagA/CpsF family glycosyltransferase [Pseudorhizobium sp.]